MTKDKRKLTVLIPGGAGFIGSNIAELFCRHGHSVIIIDGFLYGTGGDKENLKNIKDDIVLVRSRIEDLKDLGNLVKSSNVVVDCMAMTAHSVGIKRPVYDLNLNLKSHLVLMRHLADCPGKKVIYLGSRSQYGNPAVDMIVENTPMNPNDIQGIHKLAAESYYRVYSKLNGFDVVSIRFPNCFGKNQVAKGKDLGLIGSFISDALNGKTIEIFGDRERHIVYVDDVAKIVFGLANKHFEGFCVFNIAGRRVQIRQIAESIINITGKGNLKLTRMPDRIKAIDIGNAKLSDTKLKKFLEKIPTTDMDKALRNTVQYFEERAAL